MRTYRRRNRRKGIVGIESAIVMIAFVIVAAALAFVVLNMGFFTTQQTRGAIQRGLGEASSALELDGTVVAHVDTSNQKIDYWFATLKLSSGQHKVDLTPVKSVISYWSPQKGVSLANTYLIAVTTPVYDPATVVDIIKALMYTNNTNLTSSVVKGQVLTVNVTKSVTSDGKKTYWVVEPGSGMSDYLDGVTVINATSTWTAVNTDATTVDLRDNTNTTYIVKLGVPEDITSETPIKDLLSKFADGILSAISWITKVNDDTVLDPGEKVLMVTYYNQSNYRPEGYDTIKAEVKVPIGAPLTLERTVPPSLTQEIVDLG